jgi:hypothetical protein
MFALGPKPDVNMLFLMKKYGSRSNVFTHDKDFIGRILSRFPNIKLSESIIQYKTIISNDHMISRNRPVSLE